MEILPYKKELLKDFEYDGVEQEISGPIVNETVDFYAMMGTAYVGVFEGRTIGVGGVYPLWSNAGGCFLFLNKEAKEHKGDVYKAILKYMHELVCNYRISILMIECLDSSDEAKRLINHLGFVKNKDFKMSLYTKGA